MNPADLVTNRIRRAKLLLTGGTLLLYSIGFFKSQLIAVYFGTSADLDAYALALTPGNLISGILLLTIQAVLIPQYQEIQARQGDAEATRAFVSAVWWIMLGLVVLIAGAWIGSESLLAWLGAGFSPAQIAFAANILRYASLSIALSILCESGRYFFDAHRRFFFSAVLPLISAIASLAYLIRHHDAGIITLVHGLIAGLFLQFCVTLPAAWRIAPYSIHLLSPTHPTIKAIFSSMIPLLLGASFSYVNAMVDQMMASTLPTGSISALFYASRLHSILTQLSITIMSQAVFPFLCQHVANRDYALLKATYTRNLKQIFAVVIPLTVGVLFFGKWGVRVAFERGAFSQASTAATTSAWLAYTIGMPAQAMRDSTIKMFYALQQNTALMYIQIGSIVLNIVLNRMLMKPFGHTGIALSTSLVYMVTTVILALLLRKTLARHEHAASH